MKNRGSSIARSDANHFLARWVLGVGFLSLAVG